MRHFAALLLGIALLAGGPAGGQSPPAGQPKPPPTFATGKREIDIPFSITPGTTPETQIVRVDVFISWDRGRNWFKYTDVSPEAGKFRFAAKKDMEFWFVTETITKADEAKPPARQARVPQLKLIVDTQKPDLKMTALVNPSGQPELAWTVADATLSAASLKIEYQDAGGNDENWRPVELSAKENIVSAGGIVGKKLLLLPAGTKAINLRAEASDVAGNKSVFSQHLVVPTPQDLAAAERRERPQPLADASARHWPNDAGQGQGIEGMASSPEPIQKKGEEPEPKLVQNPYAGKGRLAALPSRTESGSVEELPRARESALPPPQLTDEGTAQEEMPPPAAETPPPTQHDRHEEPPPAKRRLPADDDIGPLPPREALPPTRPSGPAPETRPLPNGDSIPAGDRTRLSSARRFTLDYDVEAVGPEGIAEVELWGTSDGGKTWAKWGTDPDRTSPMEVEVSRETVYGFRIVVVGKNGLMGNRPNSGDEADIWIEIDVTQPEARLTAAAYGKGEHAGELDIRWDARDAHLGPRPVTLSFSDRPDGKYTTIAAGLPNTGEYFWQFDPRSPRQIYLKLEVRDDAGNVSTDRLADPINVEGLTPKGRIRSLTPATTPGSDSSRAFRKSGLK